MSPGAGWCSPSSRFPSNGSVLLPYGREHFARLLALAAIIVLAACYFGVAFLPQLSIHQATDIAEPALPAIGAASFTHKNGAGAGMVLLIFIGIFVYRAWHRTARDRDHPLVQRLSLFHPLQIADQSAAGRPAVSYLVPRLRSGAIAIGLMLGVPIVINLLSVGSVMFAPIQRSDRACSCRTRLIRAAT